MILFLVNPQDSEVSKMVSFAIHSVRYIFERCASSPLLPVSWEGAKLGARLTGQERKDIFENSRNLDSAVNIKFPVNCLDCWVACGLTLSWVIEFSIQWNEGRKK